MLRLYLYWDLSVGKIKARSIFSLVPLIGDLDRLDGIHCFNATALFRVSKNGTNKERYRN